MPPLKRLKDASLELLLSAMDGLVETARDHIFKDHGGRYMPGGCTLCRQIMHYDHLVDRLKQESK